VTLRVVGRGQPPRHPQVDAAGFVPDLAAEWSRATALVVPLRSGGGTRLKVLEAFAHGVPVVSTALGVEGVGAVPGLHYACGDTAEELVASARAVLADADRREGLARAARDLVHEFTWARCTSPLQELVTEVAT
jgi:glycosyltransferase involved in cell wall biosynthesis